MDVPGNAGPSSSQTPTQIFTDANGQPLLIFVEASAVEYRPSLIRGLKSCGATIAHSPEDAHIILVDPTTEAGLALAKDWCDTHRVVLDEKWGRRAIASGIASQPPDYGGLRVFPKDIEGETVHQSPLPTPRQTPLESVTDRYPNNGPRSAGAESTPAHRRPTGRPVPSAQASHPRNPSSTPSTPGDSSFSTPFPSQSNAIPNPQIPRFFTPNVSNSMAYSQQSPTDPSMPQSAQMTIPVNLIPTLLDMMKLQGINGLNSLQWSPPVTGQMPTGFTSGQFIPNNDFRQTSPFQAKFPLMSQDFSQQYTPASHTRSYSPPVHTADMGHSSSTPSSTILSPPLKRRSLRPVTPPPPRPSSSSRSKGKRPAVSSERPRKQPRLSSESASPGGSSDISSPLPRPSGIPHEPGELFTKDVPLEPGSTKTKRVPLVFVVQIDIKNRKEVVWAIRGHGGKVISETADADYVVLFNKSSSFKGLLTNTVAFGKPAVQARFVHECIKEGMLLDVEDFSFEGVSLTGNRGRTPGSGVVRLKTMKKAHAAIQKKRVREEAAEAKLAKQCEASLDSDDVDAESSVPYNGHIDTSPEPPQNVVQYVDGRNLYTVEEREYFSRYVGVLLNRDPDISFTSIADRMHAKMPHHSQKSWSSFVPKQKAEIESSRKKAAIARRKSLVNRHKEKPSSSRHGRKTSLSGVDQKPHLSSEQTETQQDAPSYSVPQSPPTAPSGAATTQPQSLADSREFRAITRFLSDGGADDRSDDAVWAVLADLHPYLSAEEWKDYWDAHGQDISEEVERLIKPQPQPDAPNGIKAEPAS